MKQAATLPSSVGSKPDENMLFPLASLLSHNFIPVDHCGGHLSEKTTGPYITIEFSDYAKYMHVYNLLEDKPKQAKQKQLILHRLSLLELEMVKLLNEFYRERKVVYENQLVCLRRSDYRLRLQSIATNIIDELADQQKRREWLVAVNKEFFDFGVFLFETPVSK